MLTYIQTAEIHQTHKAESIKKRRDGKIMGAARQLNMAWKCKPAQ
jgi:hypothetical protein